MSAQPCDWHNCAQCRNAHHVANVGALVGRGDDGHRRVIVTVVARDGTINQRALLPEDAREIARQALAAADECERLDWFDRRQANRSAKETP